MERTPNGQEQPSQHQRGETTIYLVRHAEVHNPERVLYGRLPGYVLSPQGRTQAAHAADMLAGLPLRAIYTSPLLRARQTAAAIARHHPGVPVRRSLLLTEVGSSWQGTPFASFPQGFATYDNCREPADETLEVVRRRMTRFLTRARLRHPGARIVAVSHGDPITILRVALGGDPLTLDALRGDRYAGLASITAVTYAPGCATPRVEIMDAGFKLPEPEPARD